MNKLLSILLLLPLSCLSQKIQFSTGNGLPCGIQRPIGWPYLVIKGMYTPNNKLQLGASGFIGPYRSADIFMNVWPGGPSLTRTRFYVGVNAGYTSFDADDTNSSAVAHRGNGPKAGFQLGCNIPIFFPVSLYIETGLTAMFATTQTTVWSRVNGFETAPPQKETIFFLPCHAGLRYVLKR